MKLINSDSNNNKCDKNKKLLKVIIKSKHKKAP